MDARGLSSAEAPVSALIMLSSILGLDFLSELFNMQWPGWGHFLPVILGTLLLLFVLEAIKGMRWRRGQKAA